MEKLGPLESVAMAMGIGWACFALVRGTFYTVRKVICMVGRGKNENPD